MSLKIDWSGRSLDYTEEEIQTIVEVAKNADPQTQGKYLGEFEAKIRDYLGVPNAFALTNATNALDLIAILTKLGVEDEVIIPAHTFCASAIPFGRTGAKIVWADIDPETRLVDPSSIKKLVTKKTKVIVAVHLYGLPCEMDEIETICKKNNLLLIEDCAQSFGANYKGRKTGTIGDFAAFSLHGQKNITTLGEGGILVVKDEDLASKVPGLRHNGICPFNYERENYWQPAMGNVDMDLDSVWPYNFSMTEVQAALGSKLIARLDQLNEFRIQRAQKFMKAMRDYPELSFQHTGEGLKHVYHLLTAKYDGAAFQKTNHDFIHMMFNQFKLKLIVQFYPLYRYPLFQKMGFGEANCPHTDNFFDNMVSFPFHCWISEEDFDYMIDCTHKTLNTLRQ